MKKLITIIALFFTFQCSAQTYRELLSRSIDSSERYFELMNCSKKCSPDSTIYYRGRAYFYHYEVRYYAVFVLGLDKTLGVINGNDRYGVELIRSQCRCDFPKL